MSTAGAGYAGVVVARAVVLQVWRWWAMIKHSLEDQLILHEGLTLEAYKCPADYWTIGVGRNLEGKPLTKGEQEYILGCSGLTPEQVIAILRRRGISKDDALFLLANDIDDAVADLRNFDWFEKLDPIRQKVVIDMRYNLGPTRFRGFKKMIAALAVGDYQKAAAEMVDSKWYHEVGNRSKRLTRMMETGEDYEC
jgi:lysozyme